MDFVSLKGLFAALFELSFALLSVAPFTNMV